MRSSSCRFRPGQRVRPLQSERIGGSQGWYGPEYQFRLSTVAEAPNGKPIRPSLINPLAWAIHLQVCKFGDTETIAYQWACWQWDLDFEPVVVRKHE